MDDIRASLERVRERVARAAERAGRRAEEVLLIGVSKTVALARIRDRKSTRLNSSHDQISYAVFCLKKKKTAANLSTSAPSRRFAVPRLRWRAVHAARAPRTAESEVHRDSRRLRGGDVGRGGRSIGRATRG